MWCLQRGDSDHCVPSLRGLGSSHTTKQGNNIDRNSTTNLRKMSKCKSELNLFSLKVI